MATITIKNLTGGALSLIESKVLIENIGAIGAGATVAIGSPQSELWEDATIRNAVNSDQVEIYINAIKVDKAQAMATFDNTPLNWAIKKTFIATGTNLAFGAFEKESVVYIDPTTAGGSQQLNLPPAANVFVEKTYEFRIISTGSFVLSCATASFVNDNGDTVASPMTFTSAAGTIVWATWNGTAWRVCSNNILHKLQAVGSIYKNMVNIAALAAGNTNNWAILSTTNNYMLNTIPAAGAVLTGIVNFDLSKARSICLFNDGNTNIQIQNNSGSSGAFNRFDIGGTFNLIPKRGLKLLYDTNDFHWMIDGYIA